MTTRTQKFKSIKLPKYFINGKHYCGNDFNNNKFYRFLRSNKFVFNYYCSINPDEKIEDTDIGLIPHKKCILK